MSRTPVFALIKNMQHKTDECPRVEEKIKVFVICVFSVMVIYLVLEKISPTATLKYVNTGCIIIKRLHSRVYNYLPTHCVAQIMHNYSSLSC